MAASLDIARANPNAPPIARAPDDADPRLRIIGLTRAELSEATDVTASAIFRLENGHDVRLSNYLPLIDYFLDHEPPSWILAQQLCALPDARRAELFALLDAELER